MGKPEVAISKTVFIDLYVNQKKSGLEIARFFGIGRTTVSRYIKRYGLEPRGISEVRKNKYWNAGEISREKLRKRANNQTGSDNPGWKGGHIDPHGYLIIYVNGVKIKQHRHIMELELGRKLSAGEEVHHLNGDKLDNRNENLIVLSKSHHSRLHWDIEKRLNQSVKISELRAKRYWSTAKKPS